MRSVFRCPPPGSQPAVFVIPIATAAAFVWWAAVLSAPACAAPPREFRALAPGVLTVIPADAAADDTVRRRDLPEVTVAKPRPEWKPKQAPLPNTLFERAKDREFPFDVWCLEFAFKPPRFITVQVPERDESGHLVLRAKECWYLVYRVKNVGGRRMVIDATEPTDRSVKRIEQPIRFMPHFVLESLEGLSEEEGLTAYRAYLDRIVPAATAAIRKREDPARRLLDSAEMAEGEIAPGEERWGVAVWSGVDPRIDHFSIFVRGLTNATEWKIRDDGKAGANGSLTREALKSLRLDFWRPGDDLDEVEEEMNIGYAGIFERMTLGTELMEALQRPALTAARPLVGLAALELEWGELVEPKDVAGARFMPLATVLRAAAKLPPADRPAAIRDMVGDLGATYLDALLAALPPQQGKEPLESLAMLVEELAKTPDVGERRRKTVELFGASAPRLDWLARETIVARQVAALDEADVDAAALAGAGALRAFAGIEERLREVEDAGTRERLILGLFGPQGAELYAEATKRSEGIDHAWVFRYETEESP